MKLEKTQLKAGWTVALRPEDPTRFRLINPDGFGVALIGLKGEWWGTSYNLWDSQGEEHGYEAIDPPDMLSAVRNCAAHCGALKYAKCEEL
jgi:hypothetical protein